MRASLQYIYHPSNHTEQSSHQETPTTNLKIKLLQSHPTLSILAIVEDKGSITLFDYDKNEILHSFTQELLQSWILHDSNTNSYKPIIKSISNIEDSKKDNDELKIKQSKTDSGIKTTTKLKNRPPRLTISNEQYPNISSSSPAFRNNTPTSTKKGSNVANILSELKDIDFFDEHTLYWYSNNYRNNTQHHIPPSSKLILYYDYHCNILLDIQSYSLNKIKSIKDIHQTCIAYAVSSNILCIGYNDGCVRFYDINTHQFLNYVLPKIHNDTKKGYDDCIQQILSACRLPYQKTESKEKNGDIPCRLITLYSSGISYLWEFNITTSKSKIVLNITHPTARMDGLLQETSYVIMYDVDRDLLVGYLNDKKYLGIWDLSTMKRNQSGVPSYSPFLKVKIPFDDSDVSISSTPTNSNAANHIDLVSSINIIPGLHPNTSDMTLSLWTCMPLSENEDTGLFLTSLNSKEYIVKPNCIWKENLNQFLVSTQQPNKKTKYLSIYCMTVLKSKLMSVIVYGTNYGVYFVSLEEDRELVSNSSRYVSLEEDSGNIVFMEGSSLFNATIDTNYLYNNNPVGLLNIKGPSLIYTSISNKDIRLPPRLILSPSKNYLCIFWQAENKYEIVRVDAFSTTTPRNKPKNNINYAIDTDTNITSFAWIGTNDIFAVLKVPNNYFKNNDNSIKSQRRKNSRKVAKIISKIKLPTPTSKKSSDVDDDPGLNSTIVVELKILLSNNEIVNNDSKDSIRTASSNGGINNIVPSSSSTSTVKSLGNVPVRGGIPITLFGGPVLCIASMNLGVANKDSPTADGMAYFYSPRNTSNLVSASSSMSEGYKVIQASSYVSIGPSLPYPDLVTWSDDGKYCCIVIGTRIVLYQSNPPSFSYIGSTVLSCQSSTDTIVESAKFLHGVLYVTSRTSVQCIFLGNSADSFDSFVLASNDLSLVTPRQPIGKISSSEYYSTFTPTPLTISLNCPNVLTYYHGSLLLSTSTGIYAISLDHPLLRIGILLSSNQTTRASSWFQFIHPMYHEALSNFLQRRGYAQLSLQLSNTLSLDYLVNLALKYHFTDTLESLYEHYGFHVIRKCKLDHAIMDNDDGDDTKYRRSVIECIGTYFLGQGNTELVRRIISECIMYHDETNASRKEALFLASLLSIIDEQDGERLMKRAVGGNVVEDIFAHWPVGKYVRDNYL